MRKLLRHSISWKSLETLLSNHETALRLFPIPRLYKWAVKTHINKYNKWVLRLELRSELKILWKSTYNHKVLCAYCECEISWDSWHIEHIKDKSTYPDLSFNWNNFLPSCEKCNSTFKKNKELPDDCIPTNPSYEFYNYFSFANELIIKPINWNIDATNTIKILWLNDVKSKWCYYRTELLKHLKGKIIQYKESFWTDKLKIRKHIYIDCRIYWVDTYADWLIWNNPDSPLFTELY